MAETMPTGVDDSPETAPTPAPTHSTTQLPAKSKRKKADMMSAFFLRVLINVY